MLILLVLLLIGVGLVALSVLVLRRRQSTEGQSEASEREVYDRIYGKRSMTVSEPVPVERRPEADANGSRADPSTDPEAKSPPR